MTQGLEGSTDGGDITPSKPLLGHCLSPRTPRQQQWACSLRPPRPRGSEPERSRARGPPITASLGFSGSDSDQTRVLRGIWHSPPPCGLREYLGKKKTYREILLNKMAVLTLFKQKLSQLFSVKTVTKRLLVFSNVFGESVTLLWVFLLLALGGGAV